MEVVTAELAYGRGAATVSVPVGLLQGVVLPLQGGTPQDEAILVREALADPIGSPRLRDMAQPGQRVVIVTSDLTRPCPSDKLLPPVLDELAAAGVSDDGVTIVVALGLHRPMTEGELIAAIGPDVYRRVRVVNHDPADTVRLGITSAGTPVEILTRVVQADLRICLGNLELHYFAGYSGGAKAILPGCASRAAVNANHAMMVRREACAARIEGNPVRADLEEAVAKVGVDFILNVVVDGPEHRIVGAVAGDVTAAHRRGCEMVAERGTVDIEAAADVVVVSAGGYPKDVNFYQAQKALDNAAYAVRDGGVLILVAECPEGLGNATFEAWLVDATPGAVLARIGREFVLGGHKAAAVAAVLDRASIYLVSALPAELVRRCGMVPFDTVNAALSHALEVTASASRLPQVLVLPQGGSVLPRVV